MFSSLSLPLLLSNLFGHNFEYPTENVKEDCDRHGRQVRGLQPRWGEISCGTEKWRIPHTENRNA